jgi:hypothetical protein
MKRAASFLRTDAGSIRMATSTQSDPSGGRKTMKLYFSPGACSFPRISCCGKPASTSPSKSEPAQPPDRIGGGLHVDQPEGLCPRSRTGQWRTTDGRPSHRPVSGRPGAGTASRPALWHPGTGARPGMADLHRYGAAQTSAPVQPRRNGRRQGSRAGQPCPPSAHRSPGAGRQALPDGRGFHGG